MPRKAKFPGYPDKPHASGQARIHVGGRDYYLGLHGSRGSWSEYERLLHLWQRRQAENPGSPVPVPAGAPRTVNDLLSLFWIYARERYASSTELACHKYALRPLELLYGTARIEDFGPRALKAVRRALVKGYEDRTATGGRRRPRSRKTVNRDVNRIRAVFRWAESEELIPGGQWHRLRTLLPLEEGEEGAEEREPVRAAPIEAVEAALATMNSPVLVDVARLQLLTGARSSELLRLTPGAIIRADRVEIAPGVFLPSAGLWVAPLGKHKTRHRGKLRVLLFGPQAQAILASYLNRPPGAYLFSPKESMERYRAGQREASGTTRARRLVPRPSKSPGSHYTAEVYAATIGDACKRAGVEHWSPGQLRHNAATMLAAQFGWDVARIVLGHSQVSTTAIYVDTDLAKAVESMKVFG